MFSFIYRKRASRILLVTNMLIVIAAAMLGPIYALFVDEIGGDLLDASLVGAVFAGAAGITSFFSGRLSDRVRESELIIVAGYCMIGLGFALLTTIDSIFSLLCVQVLIGSGEAIYGPAFDALYSSKAARGRLGRQWGAWESLNYITVTVGALLGGFIATTFGFDTLFVIMAVLAFTSALCILATPRKVI